MFAIAFLANWNVWPFFDWSQQDQQVGLVMLLLATLIFIYYTIWTFVTPFLDDDSFIQNFFLPRYYAIALPVVALIVGISIVATFVGLVIVKSVQKKKGKKNWSGTSVYASPGSQLFSSQHLICIRDNTLSVYLLRVNEYMFIRI